MVKIKEMHSLKIVKFVKLQLIEKKNILVLDLFDMYVTYSTSLILDVHVFHQLLGFSATVPKY